MSLLAYMTNFFIDTHFPNRNWLPYTSYGDTKGCVKVELGKRKLCNLGNSESISKRHALYIAFLKCLHIWIGWNISMKWNLGWCRNWFLPFSIGVSPKVNISMNVAAKKINEHLKDWKEKRLFFLPFLFVLGGGVWFGLVFLDWDMRKKRDAGAKCCVPNSCEFIVELNAAVV